MTEVHKRVAEIGSAVVRVLAVCPSLENLDQRHALLESAGVMLQAAAAIVQSQREIADGSGQLVRLLQVIQAQHRTLAVECEGELRMRAMVRARQAGKPS